MLRSSPSSVLTWAKQRQDAAPRPAERLSSTGQQQHEEQRALGFVMFSQKGGVMTDVQQTRVQTHVKARLGEI